MKRVSSSDWQTAGLVFGVCFVALLAGFAETWRKLISVWGESETFSHGYLIAPITAWLIWRKRSALSATLPEPSWFGLLLLGAACFVWMLGTVAGTNIVSAFGATAAVCALVVALFGVGVARAVAFPLVFLFFMIPVGEGLNPILMELTADATVWTIRAVGVPVYREGLHFVLPTGSWSVVEACSGLRYVIAAAVLSSLFAYLNFRHWRRRVLFVATALVVALLANWVRAALIVMIGHLSQMRLGVGDDHVWYGWVFFGATMIVVFMMGARWRDVDAAGGEGALAAHRETSGARAPARRVTLGLLALLVLLSSPLMLGWLERVTVRDGLVERVASEFKALDTSRAAFFTPRFSGARASVRGVLDAEEGIDLYVGYYASQDAGSEMIAFDNRVVSSSDSHWKVIHRMRRDVDLPDGPRSVQALRLRSASEDRVVWTWFTVGGWHTSDPYVAKALTALSVLAGRGDHSTVSSVSIRVRRDSESASDGSVHDEAAKRMHDVAGRIAALTAEFTSR